LRQDAAHRETMIGPTCQSVDEPTQAPRNPTLSVVANPPGTAPVGDTNLLPTQTINAITKNIAKVIISMFKIP
jgi:hypothetical protein